MMLKKTVLLSAIAPLLALGAWGPAFAAGQEGLRIYLLRDVTVDANVPNLGKVSIMRGDSELVKKAGDVSLGRIALPGQEITVDRLVVLSRLASSGIPASKVELAGAEKAVIKRKSPVLKPDELVESARSFLSGKLPAGSILLPEPADEPEELALPYTGDLRVMPSLMASRVPNMARVRITAFNGHDQVGFREVVFRMKHESRRFVASSDMPVGAVLDANNVRVQRVLSDYPSESGRGVQYGLVVRRAIKAGTVILPDMVGQAKPRVVLKRNQSVVIRVERFGLIITATGKAMEEGCAGEYIRVRNTDSQRIITARINDDGTVEPPL